MYIAKRLTYYLSLLFAILIFSFTLFHIVPSDPARVILGPNADEEQVRSLRTQLGLDEPISKQIFLYIKNLVTLNFGRSFLDNRSVFIELKNKFCISLILVFFTTFFILFYSLIVLHWNNSTNIIRVSNFLFISSPTFFSGLVIAILAVKFLPNFSFSGTFKTNTDFAYFIIPSFVLALYPMSILSSILLNELEKVLDSPYILAARAFSLPDNYVLYKYALRNAFAPYLSAFSNQLPILFTSAFIVEIIFSIPGVGSLLIKSILERDLPMLEGLIIINGLIFIVINFSIEMLYPIIDPRITKS